MQKQKIFDKTKLVKSEARQRIGSPSATRVRSHRKAGGGRAHVDKSTGNLHYMHLSERQENIPGALSSANRKKTVRVMSQPPRRNAIIAPRGAYGLD
jgi:hypothetical protein